MTKKPKFDPYAGSFEWMPPKEVNHRINAAIKAARAKKRKKKAKKK